MVGKVKDYQVEVIVDTLCNNMVGEKEQLRDISSIGLNANWRVSRWGELDARMGPILQHVVLGA